MKKIGILAFLAFFANLALAQNTTQQQIPPSVQADTTSGWQLVFSYPNYISGYYIGDLQFTSKDTGYAVVWNGSNQVLLRTINAGLTWDSLPTPVPGVPLVFTTSLVGYAGSGPDTKVVWKTIDGGRTWTSHSRPSVASGPIAFADQDTGLVFGPCCTARTTNSGDSWTEISTPNDADKHDASFADSKIGYAVGSITGIASHPTWPYAGYCQKTTDGGATWNQLYTGITGDLVCCKAIDQNTLVVAGRGIQVGGPNYVGRTTDGGGTWDSMQIARSSEFWSMSFASMSHGLIVGDDDVSGSNAHGLIYATTDTGKTWQRQYLTSVPPLFGVAMINDSVAIISGGGNIYRTITGGNFSSVSNTSNNFQLQIYPNPAIGIITMQYKLPSTVSVSLTIYNTLGNIVGSIKPGIQNSGNQQATFDASGLPNGAYYVAARAGVNQQIGSFTIQKI